MEGGPPNGRVSKHDVPILNCGCLKNFDPKRQFRQRLQTNSSIASLTHRVRKSRHPRKLTLSNGRLKVNSPGDPVCVACRSRRAETCHTSPGADLTKVHHQVTAAVKCVQRTQGREQCRHTPFHGIRNFKCRIWSRSQGRSRRFVSIKEDLSHFSHRRVNVPGGIIHTLCIF